MRITTNYALPVLSNRFQSVQKKNETVNNNVSFEGKKSDKAKTYLIYVPMIVGAMGLGACKDTRSPEERIPQAHWDMMIAQEERISENARELNYYDDEDNTRFESINYEEWKDTTDYNPVIDKFMAEDKTIVRVEKEEWDDPEYINSYRIIGAEGFNKQGKKVRMIAIHANEPSVSCSAPTYGPSGIEKTYYYPDKTVTEYCTNDNEQKLEMTKIEYKGKFTLNGKGGYSKKETIYAEPDEGIAKVVTFTKGEYELNDGVRVTNDKSFHEQVITYDENGKKTDVSNYRPDKYGQIVCIEDEIRMKEAQEKEEY